MSLLARTQDHLNIVDVREGILVLTEGRFRKVIETTAINFDLLSEDEQNATIFAYSNLVNSLDYPVQILIRTRQVDVTNYLKYLKSHLREQPTAALREQLEDYMVFVKQLVTENTVLQKRFFIVIPYWTGAVTQAQSKTIFDMLLSGFRKTETVEKRYSETSFKKASRELNQRSDELKWQFKRLSIQIRPLETEELIRLFYEIYNPESGSNPGLKNDTFGYTQPILTSELKAPEKPIPPNATT